MSAHHTDGCREAGGGRQGCELHGECEIDALKATLRVQLHTAQKVLLDWWESEGYHEIFDCMEDDTCKCPNVAEINAALEGYKP